MAVSIGAFVGALVATFLVSRLLLWLAKPLGDTFWRIALAHGLTLAFAVLVGGYGLASGSDEPQFAKAALTYGPGVLLWLVVDLVGRRGRTRAS